MSVVTDGLTSAPACGAVRVSPAFGIAFGSVSVMALCPAFCLPLTAVQELTIHIAPSPNASVRVTSESNSVEVFGFCMRCII
jgi:hypothetical protein